MLHSNFIHLAGIGDLPDSDRISSTVATGVAETTGLKRTDQYDFGTHTRTLTLRPCLQGKPFLNVITRTMLYTSPRVDVREFRGTQLGAGRLRCTKAKNEEELAKQVCVA